jgi:phage shock protein A
VGPGGQEGITVGIGRRLAELYEVKVNALLNRAEDPREVLDYSYARQQELLPRIRCAAADVAAARTRAGMQEHQLRRAAARLQRQARQAAAAGQDELARQALTLRTATLAQARDLRAEQAALRADEEKLSAAASRLQAQISGFAAHKEALNARYAAAQAAVGTGQAFGGIWEQMADVDLATRRAEDTIARLQARAGVLSDLIASGTLADVTVLAGDDEIQAQLDALTTRAVVEEELAKIKDQLASEGNQPPSRPGRGHRPATARTRRRPGGQDRRGS